MKTALIIVSVLLVLGIVYVYLSKKKADDALAISTVGNPVVTTTVKPTPINQQGIYVEPTSGVVTSKPRPIATAISTATTTASGGGAASVVAVVLNPTLLANCRIRCAATYPINKTKREACQANCK